VKDKDARPQIANMLEHPWITEIKEAEIDDEVKQDVATNLNTFKKTNCF
jgi:hypothetical protein